MRADPRSLTFLAVAPDALMRANLRPVTFLALAPDALMRADLRSLTFLAGAPDALMRADLRPVTFLAVPPSSPMRTFGLCGPLPLLGAPCTPRTSHRASRASITGQHRQQGLCCIRDSLICDIILVVVLVSLPLPLPRLFTSIHLTDPSVSTRLKLDCTLCSRADLFCLARRTPQCWT